MQQKEYQIGDKTFVQRPLLIGQVIPLVENLQGIEIDSIDAKSIMRALGPRLTRILAVVLIPEGVKVKDRVLEDIESYLDEFLSITTAMEIISDFFTQTPLSSLLDVTKRLMDEGSKSLKMIAELSSSSLDSSKTSAKETSDEKTG
ncbi:MAG: hypothetical protein ABSG75_12575 [Syntrophales bacterium]|jgi:hypothetical protein